MLTRRDLLAGSLFQTRRRTPNVVVILADDFGYGSLRAYADSKLKTPNLDRLAREGVRFTHAYATGSVCSPTRYALMAGRYYWRTPVKDGKVLNGFAPLHIETGRLTLASLLKKKGYTTAAFGKWHLGMGSNPRVDWNLPLKPGPLEIGFDYFFGMGSNPWTGPHGFIENHEVLGKIPGQKVDVDRGEGGTTRGIAKVWKEDEITQTLTAKALDWLDRNHAKPFFLYFAQTAVHRPVAPNRAFTGSEYGSYGDYIHELDASVGQVLDKLDALKVAENTLVIFTSDNGGVVNRNVPETKAALDAGLPVNGKLRGGKHDIWEGGFRVPFMVRWPGRAPKGTTRDDIVSMTDVVATVASAVGEKLPPGQAEDSYDALPAVLGTGRAVRDHVIVQSAHGDYAFRERQWKLIEGESADKDQLYDLSADPAETRDVRAANGEIAARLRARLAKLRSQAGSRS